MKKSCTECGQAFEVGDKWKTVDICIVCVVRQEMKELRDTLIPPGKTKEQVVQEAKDWMDDQPTYSENEFQELKQLIKRYRMELGVVLEWFELRKFKSNVPGQIPLPEDVFFHSLRDILSKLDKKRDQLFREQEISVREPTEDLLTQIDQKVRKLLEVPWHLQDADWSRNFHGLCDFYTKEAWKQKALTNQGENQ